MSQLSWNHHLEKHGAFKVTCTIKVCMCVNFEFKKLQGAKLLVVLNLPSWKHIYLDLLLATVCWKYKANSYLPSPSILLPNLINILD